MSLEAYTMHDQSTLLRLQVNQMPDEDRERLGEVTRNELLGLDIERADPERTGELPEGARGDPFTIGTLILTMAASGGLFSKLKDTLQSWLNNRGCSNLSIEADGDKLTLDGNPTGSQLQLSIHQAAH